VACGLDGVANVGDVAAAALGWYGRIDLLFNNATFLGEATVRSLDELSLANWQRQVNINVAGAGKALAPAMRGLGARGSRQSPGRSCPSRKPILPGLLLLEAFSARRASWKSRVLQRGWLGLGSQAVWP
jgi:NAD(P)-dependent dehydrogenase (short-subunit alcohol dehydrogenase family)